MKDVPCITLEKADGKNSSNISAIRLRRISAYDLLISSSDNSRTYINSLLKRQTDFILSLENLNSDCAFELRWIFLPQPDIEETEKVILGLLIRVTEQTKELTEQKIKRLTEDTWRLLAAGFPEYEFEIIQNETELNQIYQPFSFNYFAEIFHREYEIPLDTQIPFPPKKHIGFLTPPEYESEEQTSINKAYYVFPFLNTLNTWHRIARHALYQPNPIMVSVGLEPTRLSPEEYKAFNELIIQCENDLHFTQGKFKNRRESVSVTLNAYARSLKEAVTTQLLRFEDACFLIRIQICSPNPISKSFADALGLEITELVGEESAEVQPILQQHFVGGFDYYQPVTKAERTIARNNLKYLEHQPWIPTKAPDNLKRWRFLVDPKEANAAFRFPVPQVQEFPGIKSKQSRTAAVLGAIPKEGISLGINSHNGINREYRIPDKDRLRHFYTVGQTGTGKTTLFESMILQDMRAGKGVCVGSAWGFGG